MKIRNLTPHALSLVSSVGSVVVIPPSGVVPRRETIRQTVAAVAGLPVVAEALGRVVGLPDPEEGVVLVVSRLVAEAVPGRADVYAPGEAVRDDGGRIVGARGLCRVVPADREEFVAQGTWGEGRFGGRPEAISSRGVLYVADESRCYPPSDCDGGRVTYRMADQGLVQAHAALGLGPSVVGGRGA